MSWLQRVVACPATGTATGILVCLAAFFSTLVAEAAEPNDRAPERFDVVIVGGTPAGIMAAIAIARSEHRAVILERGRHIGGLPANGLGNTDITTRGATGGLFLEFVSRVRRHYVETYGEDSPQVRSCHGGYRFEPSVAETVFLEMLAEESDNIQVRTLRQFDAMPDRVRLEDGRLNEITVVERESGCLERYAAPVFVDATYEGDLAAAAGAPFRLGRESKHETGEPRAGVLYAYYEQRYYGTEPSPNSTGLADNAIQAYNYRLCLTRDPDNRVPIPKPSTYDRAEYASIIDDIRNNRMTRPPQDRSTPGYWNGIGRVVSICRLPNGKTDANHQASAFLSTDLAEENWPWPTSNWSWRDRYAERLRNYILGLLWFIQYDTEVPLAIRQNAQRWGLAKDEYVDNDHFPRQPYVREGRRIMGEYLFTAHDALPTDGSGGRQRPPVHADSITASHYHLDSHATRKREPGRIALEGFFSLKATVPYTVPYGVMVPKKVDGLLTPVPVSATHIGFSTLRMEPCWMALGQAAGTAASLCVESPGTVPRDVDIVTLQRRLLKQGAVLIYFGDAPPGGKHYEALQFFALRGFFAMTSWEARLKDPLTESVATRWIRRAGVEPPKHTVDETTRGELLDQLYDRVQQLPTDRQHRIDGSSVESTSS